MKGFVFTILVLFLFAAFSRAQTFYGTTDIKFFREGRDKEFRNREESPLKEEDFSAFNGLNYFPVNRKFRVKAKFTRVSDEKYFQMPTSSGITKKFVKYGVLNFRLNGKNHSLNVYQADLAVLKKLPEYADLLFVPFKDLTNGEETYGGGRYIDIKQPSTGEVILDFNLAYNPNCAYGSERYNCPIPPKENFLQIEIRAGEKSFKYFGAEKH